VEITDLVRVGEEGLQCREEKRHSHIGEKKEIAMSAYSAGVHRQGERYFVDSNDPEKKGESRILNIQRGGKEE